MEETKTVLITEQAYIQKEVPGLPNMKPKYYLNIQLNAKSLELVKLDSIKMTGSHYTLVAKEDLIPAMENPIRVELKPISIEDKDEANGAILYFQKNKQSYYQKVNEILIKEPIYLP